MFMVPRRAFADRGTAKPHLAGGLQHGRKLPILVVLGLDIDGKPHASRFAERDAPFVQRAAELMAFHVIRVPHKEEELHALAQGLPLGKIFATGRAFVPFVARAAFDKLAALVEGGIPAGVPLAKQADPAGVEAVETADSLWSNIEVGSVVLAEQPAVYGLGWWESVVVAIDGDDLTLRWGIRRPKSRFTRRAAT